ncbi:molecular chaperone HtpG [Cerasicoccus arenae]|uniref:Chaperone protein HtpG n=1 Tax=Cerasicoccus arenae TaxID=424488 RepID=A0A8J3GFQ6_9BACT|nr:molecular chaperone HtpG [Cerasicoccus arenae]MBK1857427.1 molecular chaperone HtpG [Cerasicoccus arenae]GHC07783.1 molecular chaperone HtpG [Cerasicoccus arenae]
MSTTAPEKHEFQAEVKQVLDIVIHSLYTDKEIFIRELVSNASDALEKLRHLQLTEKTIHDDGLTLEVNLTTDDTANTITVQDFGIGMTRDDLVENLGTIAHSGTKAFLNAVKESGGANESLIGQFGVGFYSVFMCAEEVKVYTRSWHSEGTGWCWTSDGSGSYTIEEAEGVRRGTKIVITLKEDAKDFAADHRVKSILERYSAYIEFPINLNGEKVNNQQAIWLQDKSEITEDGYKEFYKYQAKAYDEPLDWMHFQADAPLDIHALLYIPGANPEMPGFGRIEPGVALHCRKILIDPEPKKLLPDWLRFVKGVVDSADLPLNISRESMQDSALLNKIGNVITKRFLKHLEGIAKKDADKYQKFWDDFGIFIKEGATSDYTYREQTSSLLRFESSMFEAGKLTSLADYLDRAKEEQKEIYYLIGPSRKALESGPYLEAFKARGIEVLFCYEPIDEFLMTNLREFKEKKLTAADSNDIELEDTAVEGEALPEDQVTALCDWLKTTLGETRVKTVAVGKRLVDSPIAAMNADAMMSASMRKIMRSMGRNDEMPEDSISVNLEINPRHGLIKHLSTLRESNEDTAKLIAEQLLDNALISAGMLDDPRSMVNRLNAILEKVAK